MLMSHALISASEIGFPSPGGSASDGSAAKASASRREGVALSIDMLDLSLVVDRPAWGAVVVLVGDPERVGALRALAALGDELRAQRLRVSRLIPGAALQDRRLPIPAPRRAEAGKRLGLYRLLQRRLRPALAAVGRDQ